jgi:anti-sigma regulatory factor (Ser/Thr protein kinase)
MQLGEIAVAVAFAFAFAVLHGYKNTDNKKYFYCVFYKTPRKKLPKPLHEMVWYGFER